jgi:outer membrane biosynthesis protein TonB
MPFFALLPFIIIAIVIASARSAEMKKQQVLKRRQAEQEQAAKSAPTPQKKPPVPARPTVRPTVMQPRTQSTVTAQTKTNAPQKQVHPQHDDCALRPDQKVTTSAQKHPQHEDCSLRPETVSASGASAANGGTPLNFTPDNILRGVIFSEIFGKPKALR